MHRIYQYSGFNAHAATPALSHTCRPRCARTQTHAPDAAPERTTQRKRKHIRSAESIDEWECVGRASRWKTGPESQNENTYSRPKRQRTSKNRQRNCTRTAENAAIYRRSRFEGVKVTICKLAFRISLLQAALPVRPNLANSYHTYARTPADPFHRKANTPHSTCASPLT